MILYEPAPPFSAPAAGRCRPGMLCLWDELKRRYPSAIFAGCYADRPISGGRNPSMHRDGRALDVNFQSPHEYEAAMRWLTEVGEQLQVQQFLDYRVGRSWRPGRGWAPWAAPAGKTHLHVEMTTAAAMDGRPIPERLTPEADVRLLDVTVRTVDGKGEAVAWVDPGKVIAVSAPTAFGAVPQVGWRPDVRPDGGVQIVVAVEDWFPGTLDVTVRVAYLP